MMWSLISGLIVLSIMIIAACIGYVSTIMNHKKKKQKFKEMIDTEQHEATSNTSKETVSLDHPDPTSRVTIVVSPRGLERIMRESKNPPAYEDLTLPPPYEIAVDYK